MRAPSLTLFLILELLPSLDSGEVYATGDNKFGQLGLSALGEHINLTKVSSLSEHTIVDVSCGADFTLVLNGN